MVFSWRDIPYQANGLVPFTSSSESTQTHDSMGRQQSHPLVLRGLFTFPHSLQGWLPRVSGRSHTPSARIRLSLSINDSYTLGGKQSRPPSIGPAEPGVPNLFCRSASCFDRTAVIAIAVNLLARLHLPARHQFQDIAPAETPAPANTISGITPFSASLYTVLR